MRELLFVAMIERNGSSTALVGIAFLSRDRDFTARELDFVLPVSLAIRIAAKAGTEEPALKVSLRFRREILSKKSRSAQKLHADRKLKQF